MKTYMPLNGLRWSRNSGSANCDMPQSAVFGRPGGGEDKDNLPHHLGKTIPQIMIFPLLFPFVLHIFAATKEQRDQ